METISFHSNQTSYPSGIKNIIDVEADVLTAKTQSGWALGFHFCQKIVLMVDMF